MNYRKKANITLSIVFIGFLGSVLLKHRYPDIVELQLLNFMLEAALVGGIADWFAVTAIFKKPLGWGYHTELIPRNRVKLIEAVAGMVQTELLHMDLIRRKISGIDFLDGLIQFVERRGGAAYLADKTTLLIQGLAGKQDPGALAEKLAELLQKNAEKWTLAPWAEKLSRWALTKGYLDQGLDRLTELLWEKASEAETRLVILNYLETIKAEKLGNGGSIFRTLLGFVEMSDGLNMEEAADALHIELLLTLRKFNDPADPLRLTLKKSLVKNLDSLMIDPNFRDQLELWKKELLHEEFLKELLTKVLRITLDTASTDSETLNNLVGPYVRQGWHDLLNNKPLQVQLNTLVIDIVCQAIQNEHHEIGTIVRETLTSYSNEDLNRFVEEKAGNDLQWIRINGSMIGGAVGMFLFLFLDYVYDPYIGPFIMSFAHQFH
ncbi:putative membrane protein [Desulfosporosinus acidiphilus SJ4]|uniref:Putative membrane protein n=1 Tax=Desulfosporosinus acidiphilus (strain DSM 22704 / JCM 16185 / SJ4) TaxID=646529 RepID=I4DBY1_DESAJ|nr:DUF445 domain-containing protein [Desulfosporosinus acidiphilus]AFM43305.1 putative membrane protein [Desulfosporosinus acidiphilus SJ4]